MNKFIVDEIEYYISRNPYTGGPMIARIDGFPIDNRKEICRRFLRDYGWTDNMLKNRITNDLERKINSILNGKEAPLNIDNDAFSRKTYNPETIEKIITASTDFYNELRVDECGRFRSWEHNYKVFHDARKNDNPDYNYLSLHLSFYLASWGMYRGSSFLLQKDYRIHIPIIK